MDSNNKKNNEYQIIKDIKKDDKNDEFEIIENEENENNDDNKEEVDSISFEDDEKNDNTFLPQNSILFKDDLKVENKNEEIFKSIIFTKMKEDHKNLMKEKKGNEVKSKLRNLMNCGSCKKNLQDLFFCPFCKKYACKNCFNKQYYYLKRDHTPCPICRKMVKRAALRPVTLLKAISEVIEEEEDDSIIKFSPSEFVSKCDKHKLNKLWAFCIDCNKKMCPVCFNVDEHK